MTPTFFTDRDLGKAFPSYLSENNIIVERHADHFLHDTKDEEWLTEIGRRGWVAISHDQRIRYTAVERDAVMVSGLGLLVMIGKSKPVDLAINFLNTYPAIEDFLVNQPKPFIAKIHKPSSEELIKNPKHSGRVVLRLSHSEWQAMVAK